MEYIESSCLLGGEALEEEKEGGSSKPARSAVCRVTRITCDEEWLAQTIGSSNTVLVLEEAEVEDGDTRQNRHIASNTSLWTKEGGIHPSTTSESGLTT